MPTSSSELAASSRTQIRIAGAVIVVAFWAIMFGEGALTDAVEVGVRISGSLMPRVYVLIAGMIVSYSLVEVTVRLVGRTFGQRLIVSAAAATLAWILVAWVNFLVFMRHLPESNAAQLIYGALFWSWFMYSLAGGINAVAYYSDLRERDCRLGELSVIARDAQLRALRYQLNPHFLFNTLNSIASLISEGSATAAENMVEDLSDFLRSSLALDPVEDITLARELDLQKLYLGIEMIRFPDRLRVEVDVPEALRGALVPSLITQAVVENAIRHSVALSRSAVTIKISAREISGALEIQVANRGGKSGKAPVGTGVGLRNISDRLHALFNLNGKLEVTAMPDGYRVTITLPLRFASELRERKELTKASAEV